MKFIKLLALVLCMALLAMAFVACSKDDEDAADTTAAAADNAETTAADDAEAEETTEETQASIDMYSEDKDPYAQDLENWD